MKKYGPKGLISLDDETVLSRQIRQLTQVFSPIGRIIVVVGFQAERIRAALKGTATVVENRQHETTNVAYSIALGLSQTTSDYSLVVYGDLVFNREILYKLKPGKSSILVNDDDEDREGEVGVTIVDGLATQFSYGLPTKWSQITLFHPKERRLFIEIAREHHRRKYFGYEILNEVLERGGEFQAVRPCPLLLAEIDTAKDILAAREIVLTSY